MQSACSTSNVTPSSSAGIVPPDPHGPAPDGTAPVVFAISRLYFGDGSTNDPKDDWRRCGLDLDGKTTNADSKDVCTLAPGSLRSVQRDGDNGIDNTFGHNLIPILASFGGTATQDANVLLAAGDSTLMIELRQLGTGPSYSPITGVLYRAAPAAHVAWDGTDLRDIDLSSFVSGSPSSPALELGRGYMNGRVFFSEPAPSRVPFDLHFPTRGHSSAPLMLARLQLLVRIDPGNRTATGVIGAIVSTEDALAWTREYGRDSPRSVFCLDTAADQILEEIVESQDILSDGTNHPDTPCNAISIGIGFDAVAVTLGGYRSSPPPPPDACDAGAD